MILDPKAPNVHRFLVLFGKAPETRFYWKNKYKTKVSAPPCKAVFEPNSHAQVSFSEFPARAAHLSTFGPLGCGQGHQKGGVLIFWARFRAGLDFRGAPPGFPKSPLNVKKLKNGVRKVGGRTPYILAYEKNLIWASIWEGFGIDLDDILASILASSLHNWLMNFRATFCRTKRSATKPLVTDNRQTTPIKKKHCFRCTLLKYNIVFRGV